MKLIIITFYQFLIILNGHLKYVYCASPNPIQSQPTLPCESQIYCYGPLLEAVQTAKIFPSDKTFLQLKLKYPQETVIAQFLSLLRKFNGSSNLDPIHLKLFVKNHFEESNSSDFYQPILNDWVKIKGDMEYWSPPDWKADLPFLAKIKDEKYQIWAKKLHYQWLELSRKVNIDVKRNPELYSTIYMKHGFILPSSNATEMRYFDSYFIVRALLISGMHETAKGIAQNLIDLADRYHKCPYGNRHYYTGYSSGPPLLIPMVNEIYRITNDSSFVISNLKQLEIENEYWRKKFIRFNRAPTMYGLAVYQVDSNMPRPFEYFGDVQISGPIYKNFLPKFYTNLGSMTESGWDGSSRWLTQTRDAPNFSLRSIRTIDTIPADLNAILCLNEKILASFYKLARHQSLAVQHSKRALELQQAIQNLLWDDDRGSWFDMDLQTEQKITKFYASNLIPLFAQCSNSGGTLLKNNATIENKILSYIKKILSNKYVGGVPLSKMTSGFDWDEPFTNGPIMLLIIEGLAASDQAVLRIMARELAQRWVLAVYRLYRKTGITYKMIDTTNMGDYNKKLYPEEQENYAGTNAVVLVLLEKYGDTLVSETSFFSKLTPKLSSSSSGFNFNFNLCSYFILYFIFKLIFAI